MRRKLLTIALFLLASILLSASAFADKMEFVGDGPNSLGGAPTYPYNFLINGSGPVGLLCDAFDRDSPSVGETRTAKEVSIPGGTGIFGKTSSIDYLAAGLIFDSVLNINGNPLSGTPGTGNSSQDNWAIWALFSAQALTFIQPGTATSPFGLGGDPLALGIYDAALAAAGSAPLSDFTGIIVYVPVDGSQRLPGQPKPNDPQEFIGYAPVPEPGEITMLGILLLIGTGGFVFRKRLA